MRNGYRAIISKLQFPQYFDEVSINWWKLQQFLHRRVEMAKQNTPPLPNVASKWQNRIHFLYQMTRFLHAENSTLLSQNPKIWFIFAWSKKIQMQEELALRTALSMLPNTSFLCLHCDLTLWLPRRRGAHALRISLPFDSQEMFNLMRLEEQGIRWCDRLNC